MVFSASLIKGNWPKGPMGLFLAWRKANGYNDEPLELNDEDRDSISVVPVHHTARFQDGIASAPFATW